MQAWQLGNSDLNMLAARSHSRASELRLSDKEIREIKDTAAEVAA